FWTGLVGAAGPPRPMRPRVDSRSSKRTMGVVVMKGSIRIALTIVKSAASACCAVRASSRSLASVSRHAAMVARIPIMLLRLEPPEELHDDPRRDTVRVSRPRAPSVEIVARAFQREQTRPRRDQPPGGVELLRRCERVRSAVHEERWRPERAKMRDS